MRSVEHCRKCRLTSNPATQAKLVVDVGLSLKSCLFTEFTVHTESKIQLYGQRTTVNAKHSPQASSHRATSAQHDVLWKISSEPQHQSHCANSIFCITVGRSLTCNRMLVQRATAKSRPSKTEILASSQHRLPHAIDIGNTNEPQQHCAACRSYALPHHP